MNKRKKHNFIWADLSSYNPERTKKFYENVFHWKYLNSGNYETAFQKNIEVAGLYQTPKRFQDMKMPAFWMSYIQVDSVIETANKARELGGIVELVDSNDSIGGIALIRDTLGAGFTVYEGTALDSRTKSVPNTLVFNELQVSDSEKAKHFYSQLFDWDFRAVRNHDYQVYINESNHIADINQVPDRIKGKYQYWVCVFAVNDLQKTLERIEAYGGLLVLDEGRRLMCSDGSEAFFYIQEV